MAKTIYLVYSVFCLSILLAFGCKNQSQEYQEEAVKVVAIDSVKDPWFDCYINNERWEKTDVLSADLSYRAKYRFLNLKFEYSSVTFKKVWLFVPLGDSVENTSQQLIRQQNDTLLALITYSFAEIDFSSESLMPVNHMAFEMKPTALVCITKVDTIKNTIDGTFKAIADDELKRSYRFTKGVFKNVGYGE